MGQGSAVQNVGPSRIARLLFIFCAASCSPENPVFIVPPPQTVPARCPQCLVRAGSLHRCHAMRYCDSCQRDCAPQHVCGKSRYCLPCQQEVGSGHRCGKTEICMRTECTKQGRIIEGGSAHVCGITFVCDTCGLDAGPDHQCGSSRYFCPRCQSEAGDSHQCGVTRYCMPCGREHLIPHVCPTNP
jgi:hypothetical protein